MASAARPGPGAGVVTIILCFCVALIEGFDIQAVGVAAPKLAPELGLGPDQMGWVFSIANVGIVLGASIGGWLADRLGRKPVLIAAVLIFGAMTWATIFVTNYEALFAVRLCTGLGFGAAFPNMMAIAAEISAPNRRASTTATMFCGFPIGGGALALFTQYLPTDYDWRLLFIYGGVIPLIVAPLLLFFLPETRAVRTEGPRLSTIKALFGEGRATPTVLLWLAFFPTLLILYLILNWLPTLVVAKGLDRAVAPQASITFNLVGAFGAVLLGQIVDRFNARWVVALAYLGLIGALLGLAHVTGLTAILALSGAAGFFVLGANYALYSVAASAYPADVRGLGSGASVGVGRLGSIIGPLLAGALLVGGASANDVITIMAPAAALAGLAVLALTVLKPKAH